MQKTVHGNVPRMLSGGYNQNSLVGYTGETAGAYYQKIFPYILCLRGKVYVTMEGGNNLEFYGIIEVVISYHWKQCFHLFLGRKYLAAYFVKK